jgi:hypothetical protein
MYFGGLPLLSVKNSNFTKLNQLGKDLGKEVMFPLGRGGGNKAVEKIKLPHSILTVFYSHLESF